MTASAPSSGTLTEQAAQWIVQLTDDDAVTRERARKGFEAWKRADPRHAAVAAEMEAFLERVKDARDRSSSSPARAAVDAAFATRRRRRAKRFTRTIAVVLALVAPGWLALHAWPPTLLMADLRTSAGEWQPHTLPDGTTLNLSSSSAVNVHFDSHRRTVELVHGEILVDIAEASGMPFVIETSHGTIQALGTRFVVDRQSDSTILSMIESRASVQSARGQDALVVGAGERVRITAASIGPLETIDARSLSDAWRFRQLIVEDRPLTEVLDRLARYRAGSIVYEPSQVERIRVTAVLPLDDTDRALQLLGESFPALRVRKLTPFLVWVDTSPAEH